MNVYLEVYGCTANKSDAAIIKGLVHRNPNNKLVDLLQDADIVVIVTCTVIATTEQRMLHRMRVLRKTGKPVIVTGCMASVQSERILSVLPDATLVPPHMIHTLFFQYGQKEKTGQFQEKPRSPKFFDSLIAPISISEGCRFSCSYCITHFARGLLNSFPISALLKDVTMALHQGCKEIQLTAQDTASYGYDTNSSLSGLLGSLSKIEGEYRIRVGMMNPRSVNNQIDDIANALNNPHIYRFLHLPVQSGDDCILRLMERCYTVKEFVGIVRQFREIIPNVTIATDVIVGFPSETEEQFKATMELLLSIRPDIVNITRFSARPNTVAKVMKGRIPTEIVKDRSKRLSVLCRNLSLEGNKKYIGKKEMILTLERGKNDTIVGRTNSYKPVVIKEPVDLGRFIRVEIVDAKETHLVGILK